MIYFFSGIDEELETSVILQKVLYSGQMFL